jgi:PGF-pre-PGF domain-containing protein
MLVVICIVLSVAAVPPSASAADSDPLPSDQVFEASDEVNVWERGIFPLRVGTSGAATEVDNAFLFGEGLNIGQKTLNKDEIVVYNPGDTIQFDFDQSRASTSALSGTDVQVVAARVTGSDEGIPNTFTDAIDLISDENANQNATFEFVDSDASLDSSGQASFSYDPSQPGHYVFFIASDETGNDAISIDKSTKNISINENVTILGTDAVSVQRGPPTDVSRTTSDPEPGDDITFDVDVDDQLADSGVTHMMAVYNDNEFTSSRHTIVVEPDEIDDSFDIQNNSTFEHSIAEVDGVADVEEGANVNGIDLSDGRVSRAVGFGAMIDFIAEDLNGTAPETNRVRPNTTLNASLDVDVGANGEDQLTVETVENWEEGDYTFVYIGTLDDNKSAIVSETATFEIDEADDGSPGSPGGGGGGGDDDDEDPPQPEVEGDAVASSTFDSETQTLSTQVDSAAAGSSVSSSFDSETTERNLRDTGASLNRITTSFREDTQNVRIDASYSQTNPSEDTPDLSEQTGAETISYANVDTTASDEAIERVEFEFSVSRDRLARNDLSPDEVALYRFNDGEYEEYDAAIDSEGDDRVTYTAEVPGLSVFAIGEETDQVTTTATPEPDTATPEPDTHTPEPDTATPEPGTDTPTTTTSDPLIPGFGFTTAILALLAAALIAIQRRSKDE